MKVEVTTIGEFCAELAAEAKEGNVHAKTVRVRVDRTPEQDEEVSFEVGLWATAVIKREDGEWLLEFGEVAGVDEPPDLGGSSIADKWRQAIREVAEDYELSVRPGKIELW